MKENESNWKNRITGNWSISRIIRLLSGLALIILGSVMKESIINFLGVLLFLQGLLNLSCCGTGGCSMGNRQKQVYKDVIKPYKPKK
ncbi:MAG: hypothetical protein LKH27_04300 [Prevotella sp.]|jgi:hypothetical protein|nr:hypothetical protein [Prevotella sp.]MCH3970055.1 hypothetical protein [Prevotella sp.]MCH3985945.1 hypothetical protein [Prevotella sp.]MCH3991364.1 hypothetical protein [Prevotella sp.]MCH4018539.1 hypothetical protein [Prevotella sp.]MCH4100351.1 hypothetical protein [Prevotella sp.]